MIRPTAWTAALAALMVTVIAAAGLATLRFEDDYKQIFRADGEAWDTYVAFLEHFPAEEHNLLAVLHGPLLSVGGLRALQQVETALAAHPSVAAVYSPLSPPRIRTLAEEFLESRDGSIPHTLRERAVSHPVLSRGMLSADGETALLVVTLRDTGEPGPLVDTLRGRIATPLSGAGVTAELAGIPAIRAALKAQVRHDQLVFDSLAALFASLAALWLFRSLRTVAVVAIGPALGVAWTLGAMGLAGVPINVLTQMVAALVLVVGYTDAVHVADHLRHALRSGANPAEASRQAWRTVGPACLVTSLTTAAGFASLLFSDAWMVRQFGAVCAAGSLLVFAAVMLSTPLMARLLAGAPVDPLARMPALGALQRLRRHPRAVAGAGLAVTVLLVVSAFEVRPDYRFQENLPPGHEVRTAFARADAALGGLLPLSVWLRAAPGTAPAELVDRAGAVASTLRERTSLPWLGAADFTALVPGGLDSLPAPLAGSLLDADAGMAVINTVLPDTGARDTVRTLARVQTAVAAMDDDIDGSLRVTGIAALAAAGSQGMIADLGTSLAAAAVMIFAIIALLLRSIRYGLISFIPNVAPIAMVAATLVWLDEPLRYASVLVFTICLGLAVDDTVHVIMRFRRERAAGRGIDDALDATVNGTGRVLLATTAILVAGFAALTVSATPTVVLMGALSCLAIATALVVDLTLLPALLALLARR